MNLTGVRPVETGSGSRGVLSLIRMTLRPWKRTMVVVGIVVLTSAAIELTPPLVLKSVVDAHLAVGREDGLFLLGVLYLGAIAAVQAATFIYTYLVAKVAQGAISSLRVRLFAHLLGLPVSYHDRTPVGEMLSRCTADVETLETLFSSGVARLLADTVRLVTLGIAMVVLSPALSLVAAAVLPPLIIVTRLIQVRIRDAERANRAAIGTLNTQLQETLGGVEVIRAFGREDRFVARFRGALGHVVAAYNQATRFNAIYPPATVLMSAVAVAAFLLTGGQNAFGTWGVSLGTLVAFIYLFQRFFAPITALGEEWQTVQGAVAGAERIANVLALPAEKTARGEALAPSNSEPPALELRSVVFGYDTEPVLHGMSLSVRPGEHVAIVGSTGAGKSTVLSLLGGLYRPWSGSVLVMGMNPASIPDADRRAAMGVVPQAVQLFGGTVMDNLTLGDGTIPRERVIEAALLTGTDVFVRALPDGYETRLDSSGGEGGTRLSEGQGQLLSLTRALVAQPPVLLLDEATSAIDASSDAAFRAALRKTMRAHNTAVLTIAHRLSTAREAHRVIVMEAGRVVEDGSPAGLIAMRGRFAAFVQLEEAGWDWQRLQTAIR